MTPKDGKKLGALLSTLPSASKKVLQSSNALDSNNINNSSTAQNSKAKQNIKNKDSQNDGEYKSNIELESKKIPLECKQQDQPPDTSSNTKVITMHSSDSITEPKNTHISPSEKNTDVPSLPPIKKRNSMIYPSTGSSALNFGLNSNNLETGISPSSKKPTYPNPNAHMMSRIQQSSPNVDMGMMNALLELSKNQAKNDTQLDIVKSKIDKEDSLFRELLTHMITMTKDLQETKSLITITTNQFANSNHNNNINNGMNNQNKGFNGKKIKIVKYKNDTDCVPAIEGKHESNIEEIDEDGNYNQESITNMEGGKRWGPTYLSGEYDPDNMYFEHSHYDDTNNDQIDIDSINGEYIDEKDLKLLLDNNKKLIEENRKIRSENEKIKKHIKNINKTIEDNNKIFQDALNSFKHESEVAILNEKKCNFKWECQYGELLEVNEQLSQELTQCKLIIKQHMLVSDYMSSNMREQEEEYESGDEERRGEEEEEMGENNKAHDKPHYMTQFREDGISKTKMDIYERTGNMSTTEILRKQNQLSGTVDPSIFDCITSKT